MSAKIEGNKGPRKRGPSLRGRTPNGGPNPIDVHVGGRIRQRRMLLGMSQERLGELLGLTFQQVQKYERGANRVSASRLFDLARILDVPVSFFFDDMGEGVQAMSPALIAAAGPDELAAVAEEALPDPLLRRETLELVRAYYRISSPQVRKQVQDLARVLGATAGAATA